MRMEEQMIVMEERRMREDKEQEERRRREERDFQMKLMMVMQHVPVPPQMYGSPYGYSTGDMYSIPSSNSVSSNQSFVESDQDM